MRKIIFCVSLFLPTFLSAQLEKSALKLLRDKSVVYVDSSIMYTIDTNNRNRALQPHGVWRIRNNASKVLMSIVSYFDGKMHGHVLGFFSNGQIAHSKYYDFDVLSGPAVSFWQNGSPQASMFYENGVVEGVLRNYDTSANLIRVSEVRNGKKNGVEIELYPSGNVRVYTKYLEGEESGLRYEYKDDNSLMIVAEYEMRNGVRILGRYYENGKVIKIEEFKLEEEMRKKEELRNKKDKDND